MTRLRWALGVVAAWGRAVTVGSVDFRPWSLQLTLNDLAVATLDGQGKQFTLARLQANLELESLLRMAPVLDAPVSLDATKTVAAHAEPTGVTGQNDAQTPVKSNDWKLALHALRIQRPCA